MNMKSKLGIGLLLSALVFGQSAFAESSIEASEEKAVKVSSSGANGNSDVPMEIDEKSHRYEGEQKYIDEEFCNKLTASCKKEKCRERARADERCVQ